MAKQLEVLVQTLRHLFEIGEDNDGQIIIYTNCYMGDDDFPVEMR